VNRGPAHTIIDYMKLPKDQLEPIMSNSENIIGFGPNAYSKPATGMNILRETIMGRELFDYAFKEYARRWAFKHPEPADLFRTMEDASGEDLDWFWRGWFYGIEACDISLDTVKYFKPDFTSSPVKDTVLKRNVTKPNVNSFEDISKVRNREDQNIVFETDKDTTLRDFYWRYARGIEPYDTASYTIKSTTGNPPIDDATKAKVENKHFYELKFSNKGGLIMPVILEWTYADGTKETEKIPAQIWRKNEKGFTKVFIKDKQVTGIKLDPMRETADIDETNNKWPNNITEPSKFTVFKQSASPFGPVPGTKNPMQNAAEKKQAF
jgi:hypothetical protein